MKISKTFLISLLVNLCFIGYFAWNYFNPPTPVPPKIVQLPPKIKYRDNPLGGSQIAETTSSNATSEKIQNYILPALNIASEKLEKQIEITSVQTESLSKKDIDLEAIKKEKDLYQRESIVWKNKWLSSVVNLNDSTNVTTVNAETNIAITKKNKKTYVSVMSPNENVFYNGLKVYEQEIKPNYAFMEISTDFSMLKNNIDLNIKGLDYRGYIYFEFNPDGKWKPYIFLGGQTQFNKFQDQYGVGVRTRISKF